MKDALGYKHIIHRGEICEYLHFIDSEFQQEYTELLMGKWENMID